MSETLTLAELRYSLETAAEHLMRLHGRFPDDTPPEVAFNVGQALGVLHKTIAAIPSAKAENTIWRGVCGVCHTLFEHPKMTADNPSPAGTFCPVCRDERRMIAPGIVHWAATSAKASR